jgi:hypothetical protein
MAAQDRDVYDKSTPAPKTPAKDPPNFLDQLTDALWGAGHGTRDATATHGGKTVDKVVDEAVKGVPGNTTEY